MFLLPPLISGPERVLRRGSSLMYCRNLERVLAIITSLQRSLRRSRRTLLYNQGRYIIEILAPYNMYAGPLVKHVMSFLLQSIRPYLRQPNLLGDFGLCRFSLHSKKYLWSARCQVAPPSSPGGWVPEFGAPLVGGATRA